MEEIMKSNTNEVITSTLLREDAFELNDEQKIYQIEHHFAQIMKTLGLDLNDDSLSNTPRRVAKMFVKETFSGLNPINEPEVTLFENKYEYNRMLVEKNITLFSTCEHHFVPIIGKVHVAYFPDKEVIGLSKINRIVQYYAKRPQVQERLTIQIAEALKSIFGHDDVAVLIYVWHRAALKIPTATPLLQAIPASLKIKISNKNFCLM